MSPTVIAVGHGMRMTSCGASTSPGLHPDIRCGRVIVNFVLSLVLVTTNGLRLDARIVRFEFPSPVQSPVEVRQALVAMARA